MCGDGRGRRVGDETGFALVREIIAAYGSRFPDWPPASPPLWSGVARRGFRQIIKELEERRYPVVYGLPGPSEAGACGKSFRGKKLAKLVPGRSLANREYVECDFQQADLSHFDLRGGNFSESRLIAAVLPEARAEGAKFIHSDCRWSLWRMASLCGSNLTGANFCGADLRGCDFTGCDLSGADFRAAAAGGANFSCAELTACNFGGADLSRAVFGDSTLEETNFSFANLDGCHFYPTNFGGGIYYKVRYGGVEPLGWPRNRPQAIFSREPERKEDLSASLRYIRRYRDIPGLLRIRLFYDPDWGSSRPQSAC